MVPVVVVGRYVVIGYTDDEATGAEILKDAAGCRKAGCKDAVRDLMEEDARLDHGYLQSKSGSSCSIAARS
jgi:hypothetical protein